MTQTTGVEPLAPAGRKGNRLCMVVPFFPPNIGGIERYALNTALRLHRLGWQVAVLTTRVGDEPEIARQEDIDLFRLDSVTLGGRMPVPQLWRRSVGAILDALHDWNADIFLVHTHLFPICLAGARLARRRDRPVLLLGHGSGYVETPSRLQNLLLRGYEHGMAALLRGRICAAYGVSARSSAWWHRFGIQPSGTFYNGIDLPRLPPRDPAARREFGLPEGGPLVAFAARLLTEKGADSAVKGFLKIATGHPHARLAIAGDGPARPAVQALAGGHPQVHFLGMLDHPATLRLLGASDIFAYPSRYPEGLPTTVLEAGAMGCAVVATPMGGTAEVVIDDRHGRLVTDEGALTAALDELLSDRSLCRLLGENLRQHVMDRFNWDTIVTGLSDELASVLLRQPSKVPT